MEHAAFESPLNDEQLKQLGRLALNFGYAELLLDALLSMLMRVDGRSKLALITPLATRRKLELVGKFSSNLRTPDAEPRLKTACLILESANSERNQVIHGYWASRANEETRTTNVASHFSKDPAKATLSPERLSPLADEVAVATRHLLAAIHIISETPSGDRVIPAKLYSGKGKPPDWLVESGALFVGEE